MIIKTSISSRIFPVNAMFARSLKEAMCKVSILPTI